MRALSPLYSALTPQPPTLSGTYWSLKAPLESAVIGLVNSVPSGRVYIRLMLAPDTVGEICPETGMASPLLMFVKASERLNCVVRRWIVSVMVDLFVVP